jgi:uncharacterized protein (TIRG00374 family)
LEFPLKNRSHFWITLSILLTLFVIGTTLLIHLLRDLDWSSIGRAAPLYLGLILALSIAETTFYTLAVHVLIRASGYNPTLLHTYLLLTSSLSTNYITPIKAGVPLRVYLYKQFLGIPVATGTALITVELLIGIVIPALIAVVGIVSLFPFIGLVGPLALLIVVGCGAMAILFFSPERMKPLAQRLPFQGLVQRVMRFSEQTRDGLANLPVWSLLSMAGLVALTFAAVTMRLYVILQMLGHPVSLLALLYAQMISITSGNISLIPMGLGVRDASLMLLLLHLGVPREVAISVAIIQRLLSPGWPLLLGMISSSILGTRMILANAEESENGDLETSKSGQAKCTPQD